MIEERLVWPTDTQTVVAGTKICEMLMALVRKEDYYGPFLAGNAVTFDAMVCRI